MRIPSCPIKELFCISAVNVAVARAAAEDLLVFKKCTNPSASAEQINCREI